LTFREIKKLYDMREDLNSQPRKIIFQCMC